MPRGRPIDPDSLTQRILAELADEQWKDTHELARVLGAPARRVGDIFGHAARSRLPAARMGASYVLWHRWHQARRFSGSQFSGV